jgi:hypothetical protein
MAESKQSSKSVVCDDCGKSFEVNDTGVGYCTHEMNGRCCRKQILCDDCTHYMDEEEDWAKDDTKDQSATYCDAHYNAFIGDDLVCDECDTGMNWKFARLMPNDGCLCLNCYDKMEDHLEEETEAKN